MKGFVLSCLLFILLNSLSSCQHASEKPIFQSPQDLMLGLQFHQTNIDDIKRRFGAKKHIFIKYNSYLIPIQNLNFPNVENYELIFDNQHKLSAIAVGFSENQYEEIFSLLSTFNKPITLGDEYNPRATKGFVIDKINYVLIYSKNCSSILIFLQSNADYESTMEQHILKSDFEVITNLISKHF